MPIFYARLTEICQEKGTSPQPLCIQLGISSGTVTGWKKGASPNAEKLKTIANYLDVSIDWLLGRTENRNAHKCNMSEAGGAE